MHLATLVGLCERGHGHIRSAYQFLFIGQHKVAEIEEVIKASFSLCHFLLEGWKGRREGGREDRRREGGEEEDSKERNGDR